MGKSGRCNILLLIKPGGFVVITLFFGVLIVSFMHGVLARQSDPYKSQKIERRTFDDGRWSELKNDLDYGEREAIYKPKPSKQNKFKWPAPLKINSIFIKSLFFLIAVGLIVFVLIKLLGKADKTDKSLEKTVFNLENIEESIHEADVESFLRQAREGGDYKQVIRLYYLIIIRELSNKKFITWKKDKTNSEYVSEMQARTDYRIFRDLTSAFEVVWYSEKVLADHQYEHATVKFQEYINDIKKNTFSARNINAEIPTVPNHE